MNRFAQWVVTVLFVLTSGVAHANEADVQAVRQLLHDQVTAWNRGDLQKFMETYWQSPQLTFFSGGDRQKGWEETYQRFRQRYQTEGKEMGRLEFSDLMIDPLSVDCMLVRGRWKLRLKTGAQEGLFTLIVARQKEGWRIIHDHTSARQNGTGQP
jgi:beta-aspartyl-peptidase (threonine type)